MPTFHLWRRASAYHLLVDFYGRFEIADRLFLLPDEMLGPVVEHLISRSTRQRQRFFAIGDCVLRASQKRTRVAAIKIERCQFRTRQLLRLIAFCICLQFCQGGSVGFFTVEDRGDIGDRAGRRHEACRQGIAQVNRFLLGPLLIDRDRDIGAAIGLVQGRNHTISYGGMDFGAATSHVAARAHAGLDVRFADALSAGFKRLLLC